LRGRAGPALAGGFERRWAGSTDIFKVLSNFTCTRYSSVLSCTLRKGQLNRHTRYRPVNRPATTTRNTGQTGAVTAVASLGGLTHRRGFSRIRPPPPVPATLHLWAYLLTVKQDTVETSNRWALLLTVKQDTALLFHNTGSERYKTSWDEEFGSAESLNGNPFIEARFIVSRHTCSLKTLVESFETPRRRHADGAPARAARGPAAPHRGHF